MTVSNIYAPAGYATDGSTVTFPVPFPFAASSDLVVIYAEPAAQTATVLTLNGGGASGYIVTPGTLAGGFYENGSVTLNVAKPSNNRVIIDRATTMTQDAAFNPVGNLPVQDVEAGLDRLTLIVQELQQQVNRCIRAPAADIAPAMLLPMAEIRAEDSPGPQVLVFDDAGDVGLNNALIGVPGPPGPAGVIDTAQMALWLLSLPTAPSGTVGWWNNSGVPNYS